jgi:PKD repeat protein
VTLTTSNAFGSDTKTKAGHVEVLAVITDFSGTPRSGGLPLEVAFTDLTVNDPTSWLWDFGDGNASSEQHPLHTYTTPGTFTVTLTSSNALGSDTKARSGYVQALPVTANFSGTPRTGGPPLSVSFMDLSTNGPTSWLWDFGDGGTSSEQHPTHAYTSVGTFTVTLTAGNAFGSDVETKSGYIQALGVNANFAGTPRNGVVPLDVTFLDVSTNGPTSWLWDFGDGSTSTLQHPTHTYTSIGTFTVSLTASNAYSTSTRVRATYITVLALVAEFKGTPLGGTAPLSVQFTDLSIGTPTSWLWSFGDGVTSSEQNPVHVYTSPGAYTVTLTATNALGSSSETKGGYILVH